MNIFRRKSYAAAEEVDAMKRYFTSRIDQALHEIQELNDRISKTESLLDQHKLHATILDILASGTFTWENTKTENHYLLKLEWKDSIQRLYTPDKGEHNKRELAEKLAVRCKEMA